jgi:hypothetical protein
MKEDEEEEEEDKEEEEDDDDDDDDNDNIITLRDHRPICSPSLTETSLCGA